MSHVVGPMLPDAQPTLDGALASMLQSVQTEFLFQAQRMPAISRRLLLEHSDPQDVSAAALLDELQMPPETVSLGAPVLEYPGFLPPDACATLRGAVDRESQAKVDSVDGAPDHQLNLTREQLVDLVGASIVDSLWRLPNELLGSPTASEALIFVRRYTPSTRPWNPWHVDSAAVTANVALSDEAACAGGELLTVRDDGVRAVVRGAGDATVHSSTLLHAVSRLSSGARYSLIVFFGEAERRLPTELRFDAAARAAEAAALAAAISEPSVAQRGPAVVGVREWAALLSGHARLSDVGGAIERAVQRYAAPHLRPSSILERALSGQVDAACWSLRALLRYTQDEWELLDGACAAPDVCAHAR